MCFPGISFFYIPVLSFFFSGMKKNTENLSTPSRIDTVHKKKLYDDGTGYRNNSPR